MTRLGAVLVSAFCLTACAGSSQRPQAALVERSHVSMGSEVRLTAWAPDDAATLAAFAKVFDEFDRLDRLMSVWREGSDVLRINAGAGGPAVPVSPEVREVIGTARQVSEWTDGKFDVTFGALSGIWKFDHDLDGRVPPHDEIAVRLSLIDYRALEVDERAGTSRLARPGMQVHLGGIGKGYALDRGVEILRGAGVTDFMIQSGGDLYLAGRRGDRPWRVGIQDPRGPANSTFAAIELANSAFSTSGDYERFFMR
ncbi:MAG TPA: FAD:protein FMN transferase, partial [Vicinamibacterales bacterium]|nr:FAD:protein FMN transferase [Vicinamibacterales bacterium]